MEETLTKLRIRFPILPKGILKTIYRCRLERLRALMHLGLPEDIRWIIEAKVRSEGEFHDSFIRHMPGMGRSSYAKKRRAKRLGVCYKCAKCNCDTHCTSIGIDFRNQKGKINFIKNGLNKPSLDDIIQAFEVHPNGYVHNVFLDLLDLFYQEKEHYSLANLISKDPVCQFMRKLEEKQSI